MPIRVIGGSAKGRRLKLVPGNTTRPVMDRVKEACFSIIGRDIVGARFLDLYAGTGSVGIEALSRGADQAVFVERNRLAVRTIRTNLAITNLAERAIIHQTDVFAFLKHPPEEIYHFIYVAPPQYRGMWLETLETLDSNLLCISDHTQVVAQIDPKEWTKEFKFDHLKVVDQRRYGKTALIFLARKAIATKRNLHQEDADG